MSTSIKSAPILGKSGKTVLTPRSEHDDWLTPEEVAKLTVPEIVRRLTDLQDLILAHAEEGERLREPLDEVWSAIRKTGVFYLMVPRSHGGLEQGLEAFIDVILPVGEVDASLAWLTAFSVMHQWQLMQFPKQAQDEIWGALPYVTSAGSAFPPAKAIKVDGGYRISGTHRYVTGIMHSEWVNSFAALEGAPADQRAILCMIPVNEVEVHDTWRVDGMASTGSHDIVFQDVFVPAHRTVSIEAMRQGQPHHETPAYRIPFALFLTLVTVMPMIGAAKGELKRFAKRLATPGPDGKVPDKQFARIELARATMNVKAAELLIRDMARSTEAAVIDQQMKPEDRIRLRAQCSYVSELCLKTMRTMADLSSTSNHALSNPMQRALRDVTMISTHATLEANGSLDEYGRQMLGLPSTWWLA